MRDTMASFISNDASLLSAATVAPTAVTEGESFTDDRMKELLARKVPDTFFTEHLPPTHDEMATQCLNRVLGMQKTAPLVDANHEPMTEQWRHQSHLDFKELVFQNVDHLDASLGRIRWLDLELASHRGVCLDRFHLAPSVAQPLDARVVPDEIQEFERNSYHKNIPAILLRRLLRAELATPDGTDSVSETGLLFRRFLDVCQFQEPSAQDATRWIRDQKLDLQWLLCGYTSTLAYLFPLKESEENGALYRALGRPEHIFRTWKIPPPRHDPILLDALGVNNQGDPLVGGSLKTHVLRRHYQLYTGVLWRLVKGHRLLLTLQEMIQAADRTVFHVAYARHVLKLVEHRVQLFIDTHVRIYAWALGDGVWTDADWYVGPGGHRLATKTMGLEYSEDGILHDFIDVGRDSPITRFFPHCRNVLPCEDELPEITTTIPLGNITHDLNTKPSNPTLLQAWLHFIACKLFAHRCLTRNFDEIILRYVKGRETKEGKAAFVGYASLKEFIMLVLRCGLLGNWKFAGVRANFAERITLEYAFMPLLVPTSTGESFDLSLLPAHCSEDLIELISESAVGSHPTRLSYRRWLDWHDTDSFSNWIRANSDLTFYIFKEYYAHMFNTLPALDVVMSRYACWGYYKNLMFATMDQSRNHINVGGGFATFGVVGADLWRRPLDVTLESLERRRIVMRGVQKIVGDFRKLSKRTFIKLHKAPFINVFLRFANAAHGFDRTGALPSGRARYGLAGDDDPEILAKRNFVMESTADLMELEAKSGVKRKRPRRPRSSRKSKKKKSGKGSGDESDDDEEEEEDEEEGDDEEEVDEEEVAGEEGTTLVDPERFPAFDLLFGTNSDDALNVLELGLEEAAKKKAIRDEEDEEASASDRNLTAMAKQIRVLAKAVPQLDLMLMDMVARDNMRRRQTTWHIELAPLVELFHVMPETVARIRLIYAHYVTFDMPDYQLLERSYNLLKRDRRGFDTLRLYLSFHLFHGHQLMMPLSLQTRRRQLAAARHRWKVPIFQDMPQDLTWSYLSAGSRRFFSVEASAAKYKIGADRDRSTYARDLRAMQLEAARPQIVQRHGLAPAPVISKAQDFLHKARVAAAIEHSEKMSERMYSVNTDRATYNKETGKLYARRKTDPSLRSLRAASNLVQRQERPDAVPEDDELVAGILAELDFDELIPSPGGTGMSPLPAKDTEEEEEEAEDSEMLTAQPILAFERKIVDNDDVTIYLDTKTGLQLGRLTEKARLDYRHSPAAMQSYYDSGCRDALVPIDTVGRVVNMGGRLTVNCARCFTLTPYEAGKFDDNGPTCALHDLNALTRANRKFLRANAHASKTKPSEDVFAVLYPKPVVSPSSTASHPPPPQSRPCIFCAKFGLLAGALAQRILDCQVIFLDEQTGEHRMETVGICVRDERLTGKVLGKECHSFAELDSLVSTARARATMGSHPATIRRNNMLTAHFKRQQRDADREPPPRLG